MTGSLQGGGRIAIRQYNAIRSHLQDNDVIPDELFQELDEDEATFDELGVVTGMLDSYLEEEEEGSPDAEGERRGEEGDARRGRKGRRHGPWGAEAARFWGDPQALRDLQELGETLREHLPELLKRRGSRPPEPPVPPTPPAPPTPASGPTLSDSWWNSGQPPQAPGIEISARIRQISEELQREDLDYPRRMELSRELADLASASLL